MTINAQISLPEAHIHGVDTMIATSHALRLRTAKGENVWIYMDADMASKIADLWKHMNREPEPPTFDEALAAKCDADARMDEARALKGMV